MGKIAFVFAGQGAQTPGMGKSIYDSSKKARDLMDLAETLRPGTLNQCFEGPMELLSQTINTQPCLFLTDYACAVSAVEAGVKPSMAAGFSLGEIAALAFTGMLSFENAFRLVIKRAELMQRSAERHPGRMAAILRLSGEQVCDLAAQFEDVYPVNFNCPGQTVVAGSAQSFEPFCEKVAEMKGRAIPLNVSGAFHSPFMAEASEELLEYLQDVDLRRPDIPLYSNLTANPYAGNYKQLLADQLKSPVRWQETIENMRDVGASAFVEVGVGTTLSGLIKKTIEGAAVFNVADKESLSVLKQAQSEGTL